MDTDRSNNKGASDCNVNNWSSNSGGLDTNNHRRTSCNGRIGSNIPKPKARKKSTFIGFNNDKIKAVLTNEPGLESLSTQLKQ